MPALVLSLALCALQMWPAVVGGPPQQRFAVLDKHWPLRLTKIQNFAWQNCGPSSDPAVIRSLSISPDPISMPGDVTVSVAAATTVALTSPLKGEVVLEKKIGDMWIKVPCVDELGSCTYDDLCAKLDQAIPPGQPCPEPMQTYGIPCHCPFRAGSYNLPSSTFYIPTLDLPPMLTNGDYRFKVVLSNGDQQLGCLKLSLSLHSESRWFW
ncbi:ganglioside GM2 activator isoform X1 [Zootoca vivipara]|uniref:ganglioside GM2 activator isoform X1 n=1 Tax=Zootoca vivipara TaxID=8524 RepID=UPI00159131E7|nr:ganglioside GM2 activator isoform X1 [Zootoca vivipara]